MSMYGREDYEDIRYELDKFLEDHNIYELLKLVTDAVEQYEWEEHTVLCKDCKHQERIAGYSDYQPNTVFCNKWEHLTDIQGHCYKGERKENEE